MEFEGDEGFGGGSEATGEVVRKPVAAEEGGCFAPRAASPSRSNGDVIEPAAADHRGAAEDRRPHRTRSVRDEVVRKPVAAEEGGCLARRAASLSPTRATADVIEPAAADHRSAAEDRRSHRIRSARDDDSVGYNVATSPPPPAVDITEPKKAAAVVVAEEKGKAAREVGEAAWAEKPAKRICLWENHDLGTIPHWLAAESKEEEDEADEEDEEEDADEEDQEEDADEEEESVNDFQLSCALRFPRLEEHGKLVGTPFEKNIDIWRQLWRVLECSDLLVMVVDARDPLFYRCPDLEAYAKEIDEHKRTMLLVNKADLLPLNIRKRWVDYFKAHDVLYVFWSAKAAIATLEGKKLSGYTEEESASLDLDTKIYGRDELLMRLQAEAESIVAQRRTSTTEEDHDLSSSDSVSSVAKHVVVGFVGYPNVGKSSTINALVGEKRTGVTHTPGKTKHFQTLIISEELTLCDCPGLVFPSFSSSRHEMVACGVLPIDRMTKHREAIEVVADRVPRNILEQIYKITLPKPKPYESQSRPPTAAELLRAYCASRGHVSRAGLPDETRAARQILKDYIDGKIPHFELPPGVTDIEAEGEEITRDATVEKVEERRRLRKEQEVLHTSLRVPRRPPWHNQMTVEELDANERQAFLVWRRNLARLEENDKLVLTPFEKNIDIWRQLWRVLERSDLLVMVVDARDPLFYRCPDLEAYAKEIDEHKRTMLLVNKADLLPLNIRKRWGEYFKAHDVLYVFWSAKAAIATLEGKKLSGYTEEESASLDLDTKIYGRDELLMRLQAEAESIVAQRRTSTTEEDHDLSSSDSVSSVAKHVVVGFVGYPNVGKSSTINALFGKKGGIKLETEKTKLDLCDCPGIILPCFSVSSYELSAKEDTHIDTLAISNLCKKVAKGLVAVQVSRSNNYPDMRGNFYRLQLLAEDVIVWMHTGTGFDAENLIARYVRIGRQIVNFNNDEADLRGSLEKMISYLETLSEELYSKKKLFKNINGKMHRVYHKACLIEMRRKNQEIVVKLKVLFHQLMQWSGDYVLLDKVYKLHKMIHSYKRCLSQVLRRTEKDRERKPIPEDGSFYYGPYNNMILEFIDKILNDRKLFGAITTAVNLGPPSPLEKFRGILSRVRQQSPFKFELELNPMFKGVKHLLSERLDPKCNYCFKNDGYYFTTCCHIVLCRPCAQKNRSLMCKQFHQVGVNLEFPILLKKAVLK